MTIRATLRLVLALACAAPLAACGDDATTTASADGAQAAPEPAAPPLAYGKTGKATGVDFTVTSVTTPNQIGPSGIGPKVEAGETFVVVSYTLKNTGDATLPLMERPGLSLIDPKGNSYTPDELASPMAAGMMTDMSGMASDLNPNVSAKTKAAWKVDKAAFDPATWRLAVASDPQLTFALK